MRISSQSGFTLVELLISSFLGLLLMTEMMQIYLGVKTTSRLQNALALIQENGRFAVYILNQTIRQADAAHCNNNNNSTLQNVVLGYSSAKVPAYLGIKVIPNSDLIVIKKCDISTVFFVSETTRKNLSGRPINSLYIKEFDKGNSHAQELVVGVDDMKISYGTLVNNKINYLDSKSITDWQKVCSVQISLLLNSIDEVLTKPHPYFFISKEIIPTNRMLHKQWNTYIALRNVA